MVNLADFRDQLRQYLETTLPTMCVEMHLRPRAVHCEPPARRSRRADLRAVRRCQVEAEPLAKYVMTLLERNQELEELQESCDEKLEEFLHEHTKPFVAGLFKFIRGQMAQAKQSRYGDDEEADDRHKRRRSRDDDSGRKRRADSKERSDRRGSERSDREDDRRGRGRG